MDLVAEPHVRGAELILTPRRPWHCLWREAFPSGEGTRRPCECVDLCTRGRRPQPGALSPLSKPELMPPEPAKLK